MNQASPSPSLRRASTNKEGFVKIRLRHTRYQIQPGCYSGLSANPASGCILSSTSSNSDRAQEPSQFKPWPNSFEKRKQL
jgi:hypothetical protein